MVDADYVAQSGEVLFSEIATADQLAAAFSGYAAAVNAELVSAFIASVQSALDDTDTTMHRINEAVFLGLTTMTATDVVTFVNYRRALRALLKSTTVGVLPTKPAYPVGS